MYLCFSTNLHVEIPTLNGKVKKKYMYSRKKKEKIYILIKGNLNADVFIKYIKYVYVIIISKWRNGSLFMHENLFELIKIIKHLGFHCSVMEDTYSAFSNPIIPYQKKDINFVPLSSACHPLPTDVVLHFLYIFHICGGQYCHIILAN